MNLLSAENITKTFTGRKLFSNASFYLQEGEKVGIVGINGTGKSTLLKMLAGLEEPDAGEITKANHAVIRYLPQMPEFGEEETVLESVLVTAHRKNQADASGEDYQMWNLESKAKSMLTRLGVYNFEEKTKNLSGGERKRLALVAVLLTPCDILLLDEPTNHLDADMAEWLEGYLKGFKGTLIMVTHDRYFLDRVVRRIFALEDTRMVQYEGGYTDYANRKAAEGNTESTGTAAASQPKNADEETTSKNWKNGQKRKLKFTYQEQKDYESIEGEMAALEDKIATLEADFSKYASDFVKLNELTKEKEAAEQQLEEKMERWMYLEDLAARIAEQ